MTFSQVFRVAVYPRCCVVTVLLLAGQTALLADWRDDIGYTQLAAELGAAMPTGAGIALLQSEANDALSPPNYLPQDGGPGAFIGTGLYDGKTFYGESGAGVVLSHAQSVAGNFYANGSGIARGATTIYNYTANDFLDRLYTGSAPEVLPGRVQNHSWKGSADATTDPQLLRCLDFLINRDGRIVAVPLDNNTDPMPPLLGNNYHGLTAGVRSGTHSLGGTHTDGSGRMKPDLVVNESETSYAAPAMAGSGAVLLQSAVASGNANAEKPQVIKAQLLAGASKQNLPQWQRQTTATPYDAVFGAGELNLRNAYYIQQAGQHTYSASTESPARGWDFATSTADATGRRYFFSIPAGRYGSTFSAALTWHRSIAGIPGDYTSSLANLNLRLYASTNFTPDATALHASTSTVDNVEHVFCYNLPPGQYLLLVTTSEDTDYGLAWDTQLGNGPALAPSISGGQVQMNVSSLDPQLSYTLESSPDLMAPWTVEQTFRTADTTPAFSYTWQQSAPSAGRYFYRLRWTPVR